MEHRDTPAALTHRAIEEASGGDPVDARRILAEAVSVDPSYRPGWLWYAYLAATDGERKYCLQRAADLEPDAETLAALAELEKIEAVPPPDLARFGDPAPPPSLTSTYHGQLKEPESRYKWPIVGTLLLLAALLAGLYLWMNRDEAPRDQIYIAVASGHINESGSLGQEVLRGVSIVVENINQEGGINGHPVEILAFDDEDDPDRAREVAEEIAADPRIVLVIGHRTSTTSEAAGPVYAQNNIPVITSTATGDEVTTGNDWYFRTVFSNRQQGAVTAAYLTHIMGYDEITIISDDSSYGNSLEAGLTEALASDGATPPTVYRVTETDDAALDQIRSIAEGIVATSSDAPVVLALTSGLAQQSIPILRDTGFDQRIFASDAIVTSDFVSQLSQQGIASGDPDRYTSDLYFTLPMLSDSMTGAAANALSEYMDRYGAAMPSWRAATSFDAALAAAHGLLAATSENDRSVEQQRAIVRDALAALNSRETAIPGIINPIYFDEDGTMYRPISLGQIVEGAIVSAPVQLQPWTESSGIPADDALLVNGQLLAEQRVVYVGMIFNEVRDFDPREGIFYADVFIWLKFAGSTDAADILLVNAQRTGQRLGVPITVEEDGDLTYQLYRVSGNFTGSFDFHDFPFDSQNLLVTIAHRFYPASRLTLVVDRSYQEIDPDDLLQSGLNESESINQIDNWNADSVEMYRETVGTTSSLGAPDAPAANDNLEISRMTNQVTISRYLTAFLIKNLLPLALLAAVTYISLFIPHSQTGVRVSFGITGILTGAVLLSGVTGLLPDVDYTVAIEWAFYVFLLLSAGTVLVGLLGDKFYENRDFNALRRLDIASRIAYPAIILLTVGWYYWQFSPG